MKIKRQELRHKSVTKAKSGMQKRSSSISRKKLFQRTLVYLFFELFSSPDFFFECDNEWKERKKEWKKERKKDGDCKTEKISHFNGN